MGGISNNQSKSRRPHADVRTSSISSIEASRERESPSKYCASSTWNHTSATKGSTKIDRGYCTLFARRRRTQNFICTFVNTCTSALWIGTRSNQSTHWGICRCFYCTRIRHRKWSLEIESTPSGCA